MGAPLLLAQLLPIDPQVAIEAAKAAYEGFRKDFIIATTVGLVISQLIWIVAYARIFKELARVNEARVQEMKDSERRAEKVLDRMAVHMDRAAEVATATNTILLRERP